MVFKKPYAFLIKYFKLINFGIALIAIYIAYRNYNIFNFFNEYIANNYSGNYYPGFFNEYISPFLYLTIIILLIAIVSIYLLLVYKKKPTKMYVLTAIYYIIFIILLGFFKDVMIGIESTVLTAEESRLYRDISIISLIPQVIIIILYILRAIGLNIKNFNFESDLKEIEIHESDSEEVEFVLKKDNVKLRRNINRFIREFKYYVKENKFIVTIIGIIIFVSLIYLGYKMLPEVVDQDFNQGENFYINGISYRLEDSILTNLDYKGDKIDDYYYLVIKLFVKNTANEVREFDYNNFRLIIDEKFYYPVTDKSKHFIDYANGLYNGSLRANKEGIYSLVYQIKEEDIRKHYEIKINNGTITSDNLMIGRHDLINITPIIINKVNKEQQVNLGSSLNFSNSNLGATSLTLNNHKITKKYIYDYQYCKKEVCETYKDMVNINYTLNNTTLLVLDYEYNIDKTVPFYNYSKNIYGLIENYLKVIYTNEFAETKYAKVINVTPSNLKNQIVLETTDKIENSEVLELSFIIRNKEYIVKIK